MADLFQFIDDIGADKQAMVVKRLEDRAQMPKFGGRRPVVNYRPGSIPASTAGRPGTKCQIPSHGVV